MDIEWTKPVETYGDLTGYLVKYGKRGQKLTEILITDKDVQHQQISNLEKGIEYEFRVAGMNKVGAGQEAIALYLTPEGKFFKSENFKRYIFWIISYLFSLSI